MEKPKPGWPQDEKQLHGVLQGGLWAHSTGDSAGLGKTAQQGGYSRQHLLSSTPLRPGVRAVPHCPT
jgi:hypothetical protein